LISLLRERFGADKKPTVRTGLATVVDFAGAEVCVDGRSFPFSPLGEIAQQLVVAGGFEALLRKEITARDR
jgi:hypothetical protein